MKQEVRITYSVPADWSSETLVEVFKPLSDLVEMVMIEEERHIYNPDDEDDGPMVWNRGEDGGIHLKIKSVFQ